MRCAPFIIDLPEADPEVLPEADPEFLPEVEPVRDEEEFLEEVDVELPLREADEFLEEAEEDPPLRDELVGLLLVAVAVPFPPRLEDEPELRVDLLPVPLDVTDDPPDDEFLVDDSPEFLVEAETVFEEAFTEDERLPPLVSDFEERFVFDEAVVVFLVFCFVDVAI